MSERDLEGDPTTPQARVAEREPNVISGEATLPDEHTRRVEALKRKQRGDEPERANLRVHDEEPPREERVHRAFKGGGGASAEPAPAKPTASAAQASAAQASAVVRAAVPAPGPAVDGPRSTDLSERSRRERRRARDRRAERTAMAAVVLVFLAIGGGGYFFFNLGEDDPPPQPGADPNGQALVPPQKVIEKRKGASSQIDETPDLPALRMMAETGLTIAAEGLPEVTSSQQGQAAGVVAAQETCRFAYAVWEFSPNKRFRFLTTCEALKGQILVGAYEVHGSKVALSPLIDGPVTMVSEFEVEKPSRMITRIAVGNIVLEVNQRINTLRGGMEGDAFRETYEPRNTLVPPGAPKKSRDPLLEALQGGGGAGGSEQP